MLASLFLMQLDVQSEFEAFFADGTNPSLRFAPLFVFKPLFFSIPHPGAHKLFFGFQFIRSALSSLICVIIDARTRVKCEFLLQVIINKIVIEKW